VRVEVDQIPRVGAQGLDLLLAAEPDGLRGVTKYATASSFSGWGDYSLVDEHITWGENIM
jgi:hypothetical protein